MAKDTGIALKACSPWIKTYTRHKRILYPPSSNYLATYVFECSGGRYLIGLMAASIIEKRYGVSTGVAHFLQDAKDLVDRYLIDEGYEFISPERWERIQLLQ